MGLTKNAMQKNASSDMTLTKSDRESCVTVALAGNPNVGKSSVFNEITGLNQHTGNWAGKTVTNMKGYYTYNQKKYVLVDLPGMYSTTPSSKEEEIARDFICFENSDTVVAVCDATTLERSLNLVLQIQKITSDMVVCVNLIDEAEKKGIKIDEKKLSEKLGLPVVCVCAKKKTGIEDLKSLIEKRSKSSSDITVFYDDKTESVLYELTAYLSEKIKTNINTRWISEKLLEKDDTFIKKLSDKLKFDFLNDNIINEIIKKSQINHEEFKDISSASTVKKAKEIAEECVFIKKSKSALFDQKTDSIINSRIFGIPLMLLLLFVIFWITITGANYPSELLGKILFSFEDDIAGFLSFFSIPKFINDAVVKGIFRTTAWVVSVMLPPMAIFFPMFTILEDIGYLPRIAFNLDNAFKKCGSCGKQSLCMAMGFGCNAAGVVGARIIDSKRERLIAILTNCFVPCNGRFPTLIAVISMFFVSKKLFSENLLSALILTVLIVFAVFVTLIISKILSETVLKGYPSAFILELPPYRIPQFSKVIVRSIFDRTLFVLVRAVSVAIPAGLILWIFSNTKINGASLLLHCVNLLEPLGNIMGLDGEILIAFILGFPANEIVLPIALMAYENTGELAQLTAFENIKQILTLNGWNLITAVNFMIFSLFHWPCSTTLLTIKKETGSIKWTLVSFLLPALIGFIFCVIINFSFN